MSAVEIALRGTPTWVVSLARRLAVPLSIFVIALLGYFLTNRDPLGSAGLAWPLGDGVPWYQHYVYLADAILHGTLDIATTDIPDFYHDVVLDGPSKYLPYQPAPAVLLVPFVAIWGTNISQVYFSMVLGAINVVLFWYLLGLLNVSNITKLLLVPFFAFGTVHFYAATTGTLWFYNHVTAVFFVFLAIIFMLRRTSPFVPAIFLGLAFFSRQATILATPFFLFWMVRQQHPTIFSREALFSRDSLKQMGLFVGTLLPFVAFSLWYNDVRFASPFDTGLDDLYDRYGGIPVTFYRNWFPDWPRFAMLDVRNIPLHLYTIFVMPPEFHSDLSVFRPSEYGMSVLITSPPFIFAAFVRRKDPLKAASWLAIALVSIPSLLYFSQGWKQFGYRYMLDFTPFLLVLTALGFEDVRSPTSTKVMALFVAIAIVAGFWGRYWATQLRW